MLIKKAWGQEKLVRKDVLFCVCGSNEHQIVFTLYNWGEGELEKYLEEEPAENLSCDISIYLQDQPFWKRVRTAIRYIFGYKCRYGSWDVIQMDYETAGNLVKGLEQYRELVRKYTKLQEVRRLDIEDY